MSEKERYRELCAADGRVPVFAKDWWLDAVCPVWDAALAKKGEQITGSWAYPIEHKPGVTLMRTPLLCPYLGPTVYYPNDLKPANRDRYEHETIAVMAAALPKVQVLNLSLEPGQKQVGIFHKMGATVQVRQTFLLELATDEVSIFQDFKESLRRNIKQGGGEYVVKAGRQYLPHLFRFHEATLKRKQKNCAYTLAELDLLMDAVERNSAGCLWVAEPAGGGEPAALLWQVWDQLRSYYFMGAQNPSETGSKALSLLLWHSIRDAKQRGHRVFDFEGSMDAGVERFFGTFGGRRELYPVLVKNDSVLWRTKEMLLR